MLKRHIVLRLQPHASLHDIHQRAPLLRQRIHHWVSRWREWGFQHVAQYGEDRVEALPVLAVGLSLVGGGGGVLPPLDPREELGDEHKVDDER